MQRGFRARETSPEKRSDIAKFRVLLEQEGAALSIRKAGLDWEIRLNTAHHKLTHIEKLMTKHGLTDEHLMVWSSAEFEFHDALISGCASDILIETFSHNVPNPDKSLSHNSIDLAQITSNLSSMNTPQFSKLLW